MAAAGGFAASPPLRAAHLPAPTPQFTRAGEGATGDTLALVDANPLGTAAGYGVNLPLDREHTTAALGFARPDAAQAIAAEVLAAARPGARR